MAFRWCENMGGLASDTCTSWTPTGVNSSQTVPFANVVSGETPVATVRSTMLPITWQITPHCKLVLEVDNNGQMYYTFYDENNNIIFQYYDYIGSDYYRYKIGFAVDDTLQQGLIVLGQYRAGPTDVTWYSRPVTVQSAEDLYPYLIEGEQPPVTYTWSSVPAISGKNGILTLSTAEDSYHTGDAVSNIPIEDVNISAPSRLSTLAAGIPNGETVSVVYAGSIDHMDITPQVVQYTVSLILAGQAVYTVTPTRFPRWLGFIIDEENV